MNPRLSRALLLLLLTGWTAGCAVVAAAGIGYVISRETLPGGTQEARVQDDVDHVWDVAREAMEILIDPGTELTLNEFPRRVSGQIDLVDVQVDVEAYDYRDTLLRVRSRDALDPSRRTAGEVMDYILDRLARARKELRANG